MKFFRLSGEIVADWTMWSMQNFLRDSSEPRTLIINSEGGDVTEGIAIYNELKRQGNIDVEISGMVASVASVIAIGGRKVSIYSNSTIMVHNAWTAVIGNADTLHAEADRLASINQGLIDVYVAKTGKTADEIKAIMDGADGNGTIMTADEAVAMGFADEVIRAMPAVAYYNRTFINPIQGVNMQKTNAKAECPAEEQKPPVAPAEEQKPAEDPKADDLKDPETPEEAPGEQPGEQPKEDEPSEVEALKAQIEALQAQVAAMTAQSEAQAKMRAMVANAKADPAADAPANWKEAVEKYGYVEASWRFPELKARMIKKY